MAILKYYNTNTSAWEYVAASPTANFTTWKKTATGGETSVSGSDDNSVTLSYTPGLEQVFLNGVLLVRGTDYTATDGTSITGLSALTASDIVSVVCYAPFNVGDAVANTLIDAKGDLLVGTADNTAGRLGVTGPTGSVLVTDAGETTGLKWVDPGTVGGLVHINTTSFTSVASVSVNDVFSADYDFYKVIYRYTRNDANADVSNLIRLRVSGADETATNYSSIVTSTTNTGFNNGVNQSSQSSWFICNTHYNTDKFYGILTFINPFNSDQFTQLNSEANAGNSGTILTTRGSHRFAANTSFTGFSLIAAANIDDGTISTFGYKKA